MIVVVAMISALKCNMVCYFNSFQYKGTWFYRRASVVSEKRFLGFPGILAYVQGKIGAPYRDMTQIGWQVCYYIALPWGKDFYQGALPRGEDFYQGGHCPGARISTRGGIAPLCPPRGDVPACAATWEAIEVIAHFL